LTPQLKVQHTVIAYRTVAKGTEHYGVCDEPRISHAARVFGCALAARVHAATTPQTPAEARRTERERAYQVPGSRHQRHPEARRQPHDEQEDPACARRGGRLRCLRRRREGSGRAGGRGVGVGIAYVTTACLGAIATDTSGAAANLQTPYLLNLAVLATEFLPLFPASAQSMRATLRLLSKLDEAFSSLLTGHDVATGDPLPGFDTGRTVSTTDKVRLKGVVDRTRLAVVRALSGESVAGEGSDAGEPMDTDTEDDAAHQQDYVKFDGFDDEDDDEDEESEEHSIGSVYERTIGELGDVLGGPPIGIITEDWGVNGPDQQRKDQGFVESDDVIEF
jgi:hypothetical protein